MSLFLTTLAVVPSGRDARSFWTAETLIPAAGTVMSISDFSISSLTVATVLFLPSRVDASPLPPPQRAVFIGCWGAGANAEAEATKPRIIKEFFMDLIVLVDATVVGLVSLFG